MKTHRGIFRRIAGVLLLGTQSLYLLSQSVGMGTQAPHASSVLEVASNSKGLLLPRLTQAQRDAIADVPNGLIIYCSDCSTKGYMQVFLVNKWRNLGDYPYSGVGGTNRVPYVAQLEVQGALFQQSLLTGKYLYSDADGEDEGFSTYIWRRSDDISGTNETEITGADKRHYVLTAADVGKFIRFSVIPEAQSGSTPGLEVHSPRVGPVTAAQTGCPTPEIKDNYGYCYGQITSATTGKVWLDRNLGAHRQAINVNDRWASGSVFQWGRAADGHERAGTTYLPYSGIKYELATTPSPTHGSFICSLEPNGDWLVTQQDNLWQSTSSYLNNPCPTGFRVPTHAEWVAEAAGWSPSNLNGAYTALKLNIASYRYGETGGMYPYTSLGYYWTTTLYSSTYSYSMIFAITFTNVNTTSFRERADGHPVRCINQ